MAQSSTYSTAWALLGMAAVDYADEAADQAVDYLMPEQNGGGWRPPGTAPNLYIWAYRQRIELDTALDNVQAFLLAKPSNEWAEPFQASTALLASCPG